MIMKMSSEGEILIGNKLIAEFMGVVIGKDTYSWRDGCTEPLKEEHLGYHKQWGWLMPVVEKIESCFEGSITVTIKDTRCHIEMGTQYGLTDEGKDIDVPNCYSGFKDTKIEAAYDSAIQFIQWFNTIPAEKAATPLNK